MCGRARTRARGPPPELPRQQGRPRVVRQLGALRLLLRIEFESFNFDKRIRDESPRRGARQGRGPRRQAAAGPLVNGAGHRAVVAGRPVVRALRRRRRATRHSARGPRGPNVRGHGDRKHHGFRRTRSQEIELSPTRGLFYSRSRGYFLYPTVIQLRQTRGKTSQRRARFNQQNGKFQSRKLPQNDRQHPTQTQPNTALSCPRVKSGTRTAERTVSDRHVVSRFFGNRETASFHVVDQSALDVPSNTG
mmetsp:Transcript_9337/g.25234  ORF Transcript_9337/g.25234 Transcript_9337/m.25234 type:complete len:248 (-) Transcript_9337:61-804(-)